MVDSGVVVLSSSVNEGRTKSGRVLKKDYGGIGGVLWRVVVETESGLMEVLSQIIRFVLVTF